VLVNGAYSARLADILSAYALPFELLAFSEEQALDHEKIEKRLKEDDTISHVAMVHCETGTGRVNNIERVGQLCRLYQKKFMVDAMSTFGGVVIDFETVNIDYLISSANKCIEGLPGLGFVIARRARLKEESPCRNYSLNLKTQWQFQEKNDQFLFTPPVQIVLALQQALIELEAEGGIAARAERYQRTHVVLMSEMKRIGFKAITNEESGFLLGVFAQIKQVAFNENDFFTQLHQQGFVIYPGKLTGVKTFRICNMGKITEAHVLLLSEAIERVLRIILSTRI